MAQIITYRYALIFTMGCSLTISTIKSMETDSTADIFDTLDSMLIIDEREVQSILQKRSCVDASVIVPTLQEVGLIPLLEENLYLHTNVLNNRSLLDLPLFEPLCIPYRQGWAAGFDFFWNQTPRMNFTWSSDRISSYLALQEVSFVSKLEEAIDMLAPIFADPSAAININKVLALAANLSVEQRRIGFMLHGTRSWDDWRIRFFCPLYYLERNYFLTQAERDELAAEFGFDTQELDQEFQDTYLVSDKAGIGDTRIEFDATVYKSNINSIRAGLLATIPTAFSFKNGLKGNAFKKTACLPPANLIENLFCIALSDKPENVKVAESIALLQVFGLGSLERLSANLLDTSLGNDGHLGIGALTRFETDLGSMIWSTDEHEFHWKNRISLEYQIPSNEKRFFVEQNNPEAFAQRNFDDPDQADANLEFLEEELVKRFYPVAFDVLIQPGVIFRFDSRVCYQKRNWSLMTGAELWAQSAARFKSVDAFGRLASQLDIAKAKASGALQLSIFGGLSYTLERPQRTWILSLNGDGAVVTRGIGKDFTLVFNVETHF